MKILLVHDYAAPIGGAEVRVLALRAALRRRGHDTRLLASSAGMHPGQSQADYLCFGTLSRYRTLIQTLNPSAAWRLQGVLGEFRPDVVHARMFLTQLSPLILPLLKTVPSVYHVVWYRPICPTGTKLLPNGRSCQVRAGRVCYQSGCLPLRDWVPLMGQMWLWRRWRGAFQRIITNSYAMQHALVAEGVAPVEVLWNGVPTRSSRPLLKDPPIVAFAGRLIWEKGVDTLLRAWVKVRQVLPAARLLLAGDGPERRRLEALAVELGVADAIRFLGYLPQAAMERAFDAAWVQAVPSRWAEPFGNVAVEAMMRGTAVVASASGGLSEIVQPERTGLLVPPDDVDALAAALLRLLGDRDRAEALGQAGRARALAEFAEESYIDRVEAMYRSLVQGKIV